MNKQLRITLALSLGLLSANAALADDAVLGALLGGGAGAVVGRSIGGRDATIIGGALGAAAGAAIGSEHRRRARVDYAPAPVYYDAPPAYSHYSPPPPAYYPQQVYYTQPMRVEAPPVYFVEDGYYRGGWRHHHRHDRDWERHDYGRGRDWDDRR
jgi:hypothetical protein